MDGGVDLKVHHGWKHHGWWVGLKTHQEREPGWWLDMKNTTYSHLIMTYSRFLNMYHIQDNVRWANKSCTCFSFLWVHGWPALLAR
jgi:hypothetical protein